MKKLLLVFIFALLFCLVITFAYYRQTVFCFDWFINYFATVETREQNIGWFFQTFKECSYLK